MPQFKQVDVFTKIKFKGNPVAVFLDADHLSTEEMQSMALWTNLSETTFVTKPTNPEADYLVRIFTPGEELPFAGHPTLGTCHALLEAGLIAPKNGKIVQECKAGLVHLTTSDDGLEFQLPYFKFSDINSDIHPDVESAIGSPAGFIKGKSVLVEDGPKWACFELNDGETVASAKPDMAAVSALSHKYGWTGIEIFGQYADGTYELRNLAPATGVPEDPVCGSGSGALGAFVVHYAKREEPTFSIRQGRQIGRDGHVKVRVEGDKVFVKGQAFTAINGTY